VEPASSSGLDTTTLPQTTSTTSTPAAPSTTSAVTAITAQPPQSTSAAADDPTTTAAIAGDPSATNPDATAGTAPDDSPATTVASGGTAADVVPAAIYSPAAADPGTGMSAQLDVFDPLTLERTGVVDRTYLSEIPELTSASGAVTYVLRGATQTDACSQRRTTEWVHGAPADGLPEWASAIRLSADGRVGAIQTYDCPDGSRLGDPHDATIRVFDANDPSAPSTLIATIEASNEILSNVDLSDDGTLLLVSTTPVPVTEGPNQQYRFYDTATGAVVAAVGEGVVSDLPRAECTTGYISPRFVSSSAIAYGALCPDGIAVVVADLRSGESSASLQPVYAGRTYETMVTAQLIVDRATYRSPADAWFILCAERWTELPPDLNVPADQPDLRPCWIGHGDEPMRNIPTATVLGATFTNTGDDY
jgi:hypothetical protein